ncbi:ComEC/Rec2 family competence protein [Paenibacillus sp. UMB4589-SE434]|uniref:ComEC/Rec2 family competence protein n=1 Tax=Paenibacillus sp. UMB4589-SE434 TaxID=3046314 RepID=UPI00254A860A|nr:ComEC/Rec2 family competence protein [Paenibacillus sp. UMB4589-SE434]MDK8181374.1 ComEC/Rec2 family competence protein [Paenibacillus sp. UMB4589-SE434]
MPPNKSNGQTSRKKASGAASGGRKPARKAKQQTKVLTALINLFVLAAVLAGIYIANIPADSSSGDRTASSAHPQQSRIPANKGTSTGKESDEKLEVHFIDVGQGDSTLVVTPSGETILIDAGQNNKGELVVDYLKELGIDRLDAVVATHPDADHIGGLDIVVNKLDVKSVYAPRVSHTTQTYKDFLNAVKHKGLTIKAARSGSSLPLSEEVSARFAAPVNSYGDNFNEWSAVLRLDYGDTSFLFTGDAEQESEADMLTSGFKLTADVLKVGHHGSRTSSSQAFLNAVKPRYAVISSGTGNKYGHPHDIILKRLAKFGASVYRTDKQGSVVAYSNGREIWMTTDKGA